MNFSQHTKEVSQCGILRFLGRFQPLVCPASHCRGQLMAISCTAGSVA